MSPLDKLAHNRFQKQYFERTPKRTMMPQPTPYLKRQIAEVLRFSAYRAGEKALEVGCGMGRHTIGLAERGVQIEGLDLSEVLLERLGSYKSGHLKIPLHCADIGEPLPELEGRFDLVIGFFMLHHLHDLKAGFMGVARCLKPGGRAIFLEPNPLNPLYYVQIAITPGMTWQGDKGILKIRRRVLAPAMSAAGLGNFRMARFGFFPPMIANTCWGPRLEHWLERVPIWRPLLPFQLIGGNKGE